MSALSELLSSANEKRLSARAVARLAQAAGHTLNHDTAARYLRGDHGKPDESTLVALAEVFDVPLSALRDAAGLPSELTEPYQPPVEASRLTRRQRLAVDEIIRAMLDTGRKASGDELADRRAGRGDAGQSRDAARRGSMEPPNR
jgi:transcriptional regulator with XRE-family HTH domain